MTDLTARRQQYETNTRPSGPGLNPPTANPADASRLSGPEDATGIVSRTDYLPASGGLAGKRAAAEAADKPRLLNPIPPGAVVRIDDDPRDAKFPELTPEKALAIAGALTDLVARARADAADADVKSPASSASAKQPAPPKEPGSSPLNRQDDEDDKERKATGDGDDDKGRKDDDTPDLKTVMDAIGKLNSRLDAMEAERDDDSGTEELGTRGVSKDLAADAADEAAFRRNSGLLRSKKDRANELTADHRTMDLFASAQARADRVYSMWGSSAPKSMSGETLGNYRRRLLTPIQKHSPTFKAADLRVVAVDPIAFDAVETDIYRCAADAVRDPSTVPLGRLREEVTVRNGHTTTKFHGRPISWMAPFMVPGKRVRRIVERSDSGSNRTLYELQARA